MPCMPRSSRPERGYYGRHTSVGLKAETPHTANFTFSRGWTKIAYSLISFDFPKPAQTTLSVCCLNKETASLGVQPPWRCEALTINSGDIHGGSCQRVLEVVKVYMMAWSLSVYQNLSTALPVAGEVNRTLGRSVAAPGACRSSLARPALRGHRACIPLHSQDSTARPAPALLAP
jgi:hypothetical protein